MSCSNVLHCLQHVKETASSLTATVIMCLMGKSTENVSTNNNWTKIESNFKKDTGYACNVTVPKSLTGTKYMLPHMTNWVSLSLHICLV